MSKLAYCVSKPKSYSGHFLDTFFAVLRGGVGEGALFWDGHSGEDGQVLLVGLLEDGVLEDGMQLALLLAFPVAAAAAILRCLSCCLTMASWMEDV